MGREPRLSSYRIFSQGAPWEKNGERKALTRRQFHPKFGQIDSKSMVEASLDSTNLTTLVDNQTDFQPHNDSSDSTVDFKYAVEGVALTAVSTFGIIGNIMSVIVLTRKRTSVRGGPGGGGNGASFSNLLRGLATFDALFLIAAVLSFGVPKLSIWFKKYLFVYYMRINFGLMHTFRVGSVYVTLAVTFERFHAIIFPLRHFRWKSYLLPTSVAIAVLYNIPKYFELKLEVCNFTGTIYLSRKNYLKFFLLLKLYRNTLIS